MKSIVAILAVLSLILVPDQAQAQDSPFILRPDNAEFFEGGENTWIGNAPLPCPEDRWTCVNETAADGNTTYITTGGTESSPVTAIGMRFQQCEGNPVCNNPSYQVYSINFSYIGRKNTSADPSLFTVGISVLDVSCTNETVPGTLSQAFTQHDELLLDCDGERFTTEDISGNLIMWFWFDSPRLGNVTITQVFATITARLTSFQFALDILPLLIFAAAITLLIVGAIWIRDRRGRR